MTIQDRLREAADACLEAAGMLDLIAAEAVAARPGQVHADPKETERLAFLNSAPRNGTQRSLILTNLLLMSPYGLTHDQIGDLPGVSSTAHRTRTKELVDGGWVEDSGKVQPSKSGSPSIIWRVTPKAEALFP